MLIYKKKKKQEATICQASARDDEQQVKGRSSCRSELTFIQNYDNYRQPFEDIISLYVMM